MLNGWSKRQLALRNKGCKIQYVCRPDKQFARFAETEGSDAVDCITFIYATYYLISFKLAFKNS